MKIDQVKSYCHDKEHVYLVSSKNVISILGKNNDELLQYQADCQLQEIQIEEDFVWVNTNSGGSVYFYGNEFHRLNYFIDTYKQDSLYVSMRAQTVKMDLSENVLWKIEHNLFTYLISNLNLYFEDEEILYSVELSTGNYVWKFNFMNLFDWEADHQKIPAGIKKIFGVYNGILWLTLDSGRILGLNIEDGEIIYNLTSPNVFPDDYKPGPENGFHWFGLYSHLDEQKGRLFGTSGEYYWEINLDNPKEDFIVYDISSDCREHHVRLSNIGSWEGDNIYFWEGNTNNRFGVFNRRLRQIIWSNEIKEVEDKFPTIRKLDYSAGRLYVLDHDCTLHIFEDI